MPLTGRSRCRFQTLLPRRERSEVDHFRAGRFGPPLGFVANACELATAVPSRSGQATCLHRVAMSLPPNGPAAYLFCVLETQGKRGGIPGSEVDLVDLVDRGGPDRICSTSDLSRPGSRVGARHPLRPAGRAPDLVHLAPSYGHQSALQRYTIL